MKKVELLAPVGSMEALVSAVQNGADAVYLSGKQFGARAYASNFDNDDLIEAINYAHLYNVNVYITVNTLIYDDEFEEVNNYIDFLYINNVDAVIVQDIGLLVYLRKKYPNLDIHASTQMSIHNNEGVEYLKSLGVNRVVLARECSINQIKDIKDNVDMDLEVFIHGALCLCYSGQCLMSSMIGGRSGNRGRCAQPCRKLYNMYDGAEKIVDNKYLLSPKDLNTIMLIPNLIKSGIDSFKIEGRMKKPEYVAVVVNAYRQAVDSFSETGKIDINEQQLNDIYQVFNREFTKGHLFEADYTHIMNIERGNNRGVLVGKIIGYKKGKVNVQLGKSISRLDGIRFETNKDDYGLTISKMFVSGEEREIANEGEILEIPYRTELDNGRVYRTSDYTLNEKIYECLKDKYNRKIRINGYVELRKGKVMQLYIIDDLGNSIKIFGDYVIERSNNQPTSSKRIKDQIIKTGNTPFIFDNIEVIMDDDLFIPIKEVNKVRREAIEKLICTRLNKYNRSKANNVDIENSINEVNTKKVSLYVEVQTKDQYEVAKKLGVKNIYVPEELYNGEYTLKYSRINHNLSRTVENSSLVSGYEFLNSVKKEDLISNWTLNIVNTYSIIHLLNEGVKRVTLSPEMNLDKYKLISRNLRMNTEINVYGYQEVMISKYCPKKVTTGCKVCNRNKIMYIEDEKGEKFPCFTDDRCMTHILNSKKLILFTELKQLIDLGYNNFRLTFTIESSEETERIIKAYKEYLYNNRNDLLNNVIKNEKENKRYTRGFYKKEIL